MDKPQDYSIKKVNVTDEAFNKILSLLNKVNIKDSYNYRTIA